MGLLMEANPAEISINAVKSIVRVYDILTYPLYYAVQRPWIKSRKFSEVRAVQEDPSDPYSSWVRVGERPKMIIEDCETIDQIMRKCIETYTDKRCMGFRKVLKEEYQPQPDGKVFLKKTLADDYTWLSYTQVGERIDCISRGLLLSGVKPGDKVIIFMETRMEWMMTAQALYRLGGCLATVYATLGDEGVCHVINEVESTHIVTSSDLLPKIHRLRSSIPRLKTVIYLEDHLEVKKKEEYGFQEIGLELIRFEDLEREGREADPAVVRGVPPKPDDLALIMYTSGSTGVPKGVMAWHKNFLAACTSLYTVLSQVDAKPGDYNVAYLPLAHNLEFTTEHLQFAVGVGVGYSSPFTLTDLSPQIKEGCLGDIKLVQPGALIGVPLILDRIRKGIMDKLSNQPKFVQLLFDFILDYKIYWNDRGFETPVIDYLVCRRINSQFGGKMRAMFSGGAPLSPVTHRFARACLNVHVMQGYGATETTAITSLMDLFDRSEGRSGAPLFGCKVRLVDWEEGGYRATDKPRPRGEIVVGGPPITAGYFKQEDITKEVFEEDKDGIRWFYSGDIGEFYPDGTIKIIDRKKDLLKLQFGEYVSLGKVSSHFSTKQQFQSNFLLNFTLNVSSFGVYS